MIKRLATRIDNPTDSKCIIIVVDVNGCIDTALIRLIKKERPEIYIPNILNLNSNSGNNKFTIYGNEEVDKILKIQVYDRWGNLVYLEENVDFNVAGAGWNGIYNGKEVEQGVYVYLIEILLVDGKTEFYYGGLTVIR